MLMSRLRQQSFRRRGAWMKYWKGRGRPNAGDAALNILNEE